MLRKTAKFFGWFFGIVILLLVGLMIYVRVVATVNAPKAAAAGDIR